MLRLLCTTAHPDDEVWAFGGSLLKYRDQGVETYVICFTRGTAATNRGGTNSGEELAAMRTREFEEACHLLRVSRPQILDYPDGGLDRLDFSTVVGVLTRRIREIKPHVILTLGLEGAVTAHPDHSMVALFTTAAFHWAVRTDRFRAQLRNGLSPHRADKLYYLTANHTWPERQPVYLAPATARIDVSKYLDTKLRAFQAHRSQAPLLPAYERVLRPTHELFHLAAAGTPQEVPTEVDLFTGIEGR